MTDGSEEAQAEALARALDGEVVAGADHEAVEAGALLQAGDFALSDDRFAAVQARVEAALPAPKRRWSWLWVGAPALAAAGAALFVMGPMMSADEPAPAAMSAEVASAPTPSPAEPAMPRPALTPAPPSLLEAQARYIGGDADAEGAYLAGLSDYRATLLAELRGRR